MPFLRLTCGMKLGTSEYVFGQARCLSTAVDYTTASPPGLIDIVETAVPSLILMYFWFGLRWGLEGVSGRNNVAAIKTHIAGEGSVKQAVNFRIRPSSPGGGRAVRFVCKVFLPQQPQEGGGIFGRKNS